MKSFIFISILILAPFTNLLLADNDPENNANTTAGKKAAAVADLAPATPIEADFEDVDFSCIIPVPAGFFQKVIPVLPRHADFDDDILPVHVGKLIPALPMMADY